MIIVLVISP